MEKVNARKTIRNAASLLLKCAGFMDDINADIENNTLHCDTYYAVDTDVLYFYLEPDKNLEVVDVFEERFVSAGLDSLAFLLGDFLFNSSELLLQGHTKHTFRFLIIPPHDEEILNKLVRLYNWISDGADKMDPKCFEDLSKELTNYVENKNENELIDALQIRVPDLVQLFNPYRGPRDTLRRFAKLPKTTYCRLDNYHENDFRFPFPDVNNNESDRAYIKNIMDKWIPLLVESVKGSTGGRSRNIMHDAEVLATLEYVNSSLADKKIALITASKYIHKAAEKYENRNFASMYLRHPQAFMAHSDFFLPFDFEDTSFTLIDWLNLFFPTGLRSSISEQGIVNREDLAKSVEDIKDDVIDPPRIKKLHESWNTQLDKIALINYVPGLDNAKERGSTRLAKTMQKLRDTGKWSPKELRQTIFGEILDIVSSLYSSTVWVGLWSTINIEQTKSIPALKFDDKFQEIHQYCDLVIKLQKGHRTNKEDMDTLRSFSEKVETIDKTLYHAHIIHALAFAIKGHWSATKTLAKIAIQISDVALRKDSSNTQYIRGREASYLACIATRRSAKNQSELQEATIYLEEAKNRENEGWPQDIRFAAEEMLLKAKEYYFDHFCTSQKLDFDEYSKTINKLYLLSVEPKIENEPQSVKIWILTQIFSHLFTLLLIAYDLQWIEQLRRINIKNRLSKFQNVLKDVPVPDDPYAHLICDVSTAVWDDNKKIRDSKRKIAVSTLNTWKATYMPYDDNRLIMLKRILN
ncbi:hypothetical protein JW935_07000 [candidate division KSB1 bacterium]|nr:hypothetical protein [candidate division KSB1 bacterium]